jgi:prepilin-type N-terminal cleavage/methylation domain-containing protein
MAGHVPRNQRGFTLIELLMVVLILGLVVAVAIPRMAASGEDANKTACRTNIVRINAAIELWTVNNGGIYPDDADGTKTAVSGISRHYIGTYPTTQSEFEAKILNNPDVFPDGPPQCPYGDPYVYDAAKNRVEPHNH